MSILASPRMETLGPWHGWLFAYNAHDTGADCGHLSFAGWYWRRGIWAAGAGMPIDDDATGGRMFVVTGNGTFTTYPPFPYTGSLGMGESVVDFNLANGGLTPTDEFTSFNYAKLNNADLDQGSGGLLMVPDQQGTYPHDSGAGRQGGTDHGAQPRQSGRLRSERAHVQHRMLCRTFRVRSKGFGVLRPTGMGMSTSGAARDVPKAVSHSNRRRIGDRTLQPVKHHFRISGRILFHLLQWHQDGIAWAVRSDQLTPTGRTCCMRGTRTT